MVVACNIGPHPGNLRESADPIKTGTEGTFTPAPELGAHNGEYLG